MQQECRFAFAPNKRINENTFDLDMVPADHPEWGGVGIKIVRIFNEDGEEQWVAAPFFNPAEVEAMIAAARDLM